MVGSNPACGIPGRWNGAFNFTGPDAPAALPAGASTARALLTPPHVAAGPLNDTACTPDAMDTEPCVSESVRLLARCARAAAPGRARAEDA